MVKRLSAQAAAAASVVGLALMLTGCGQEQAPPAETAPASSPASSPAGSPATSNPANEPAPAETSAAPETASPNAAEEPGECKASQLSAEVRTPAGGGAAGSVYRSLVITNTGSTDCTVRGYPGVSYVGAADQQIGAPADRDPAAQPATVTLAPGASAAAQLQQTNAGNYGPECDQTETVGLRVYPPNDTAWLTAPQEAIGCANDEIVLMTVGTFQPA